MGLTAEKSELVEARRRPDDTGFLELEPGDYCRRTVPDKKPWLRWWVCAPDGGLFPLLNGADERTGGRISVLELLTSPRGWQGYLDDGVFRPKG